MTSTCAHTRTHIYDMWVYFPDCLDGCCVHNERQIITHGPCPSHIHKMLIRPEMRDMRCLYHLRWRGDISPCVSVCGSVCLYDTVFVRMIKLWRSGTTQHFVKIGCRGSISIKKNAHWNYDTYLPKIDSIWNSAQLNLSLTSNFCRKYLFLLKKHIQHKSTGETNIDLVTNEM